MSGTGRGTWKGVKVPRECGLKKKAEDKVSPDAVWP